MGCTNDEVTCYAGAECGIGSLPTSMLKNAHLPPLKNKLTKIINFILLITYAYKPKAAFRKTCLWLCICLLFQSIRPYALFKN